MHMDTPNSPSERRGNPVMTFICTYYDDRLWRPLVIMVAAALAATMAVTILSLWSIGITAGNDRRSASITDQVACQGLKLSECASTTQRSSSAAVVYVENELGVQIFDATPDYKKLGVDHTFMHGRCLVVLFENGEVQIVIDAPFLKRHRSVAHAEGSGSAFYSWTNGFASLQNNPEVRSACGA